MTTSLAAIVFFSIIPFYFSFQSSLFCLFASFFRVVCFFVFPCKHFHFFSCDCQVLVNDFISVDDVVKMSCCSWFWSPVIAGFIPFANLFQSTNRLSFFNSHFP